MSMYEKPEVISLNEHNRIVAKLESQLTAALAACKVKDEALEEYLRNQAGDHTEEIAEAALAIQSDEAALKAWLGEPVGKVSGDRQAGMFSVVPHGTLLYAPKGMK